MRKLKLDELDRHTPDSYIAIKKLAFIVVLDNIRSGLNVGSFFRTVDSFGLDQIHLCGITPSPLNKEINKTAIGADRTVEWKYFESTKDSIEKLRSRGYYIIGIEQTTESIPLYKYDIKADKKIALVFGNEVNGLSENILPLLDDCIDISQYGTKHSLNVSVCGGIVLWRFASLMRNK